MAATAIRLPADTLIDRSPALGFEAAPPLLLEDVLLTAGVEDGVGVASVLAGPAGLGVFSAMLDMPFVAVPVQ